MIQYLTNKVNYQLAKYSSKLPNNFSVAEKGVVVDYIIGNIKTENSNYLSIAEALNEKIDIKYTHKRLLRGIQSEDLAQKTNSFILESLVNTIADDNVFCHDKTALPSKDAKCNSQMTNVFDNSIKKSVLGHYVHGVSLFRNYNDQQLVLLHVEDKGGKSKIKDVSSIKISDETFNSLSKYAVAEFNKYKKQVASYNKNHPDKPKKEYHEGKDVPDSSMYISEGFENIQILESMINRVGTNGKHVFDSGYDNNMLLTYCHEKGIKSIIRIKKNRKVFFENSKKSEHLMSDDISKKAFISEKIIINAKAKEEVTIPVEEYKNLIEVINNNNNENKPISIISGNVSAMHGYVNNYFNGENKIPVTIVHFKFNETINTIDGRTSTLRIICNGHLDEKEAKMAVINYLKRWVIEVSFRHSKQQFGLAESRFRSIKTIRNNLALALHSINFTYHLIKDPYVKENLRTIAPKNEKNNPVFLFYIIYKGLKTIFAKNKNFNERNNEDRYLKKPKEFYKKKKAYKKEKKETIYLSYDRRTKNIIVQQTVDYFLENKIVS